MKKTALFLTLNSALFMLTFQLKAQPVADFTYAYTNGGCTPDSVVFTNTSTGADVYMWDFGDFSPPVSAVDTSHWYFGSGTYIVTLTAYDTLTGDSSLKTQVINITFTPFPGWAWFFTDPPNPVCYGTPIDFSSPGFPAPEYMIWDFGDGDSSNSFFPTHTYTDTGTYSVTLIKGNSCGSDTFIGSVIIDTTSPPNIFGVWASPNPVCPNYPVSFEICWGCDNPSFSYLWYFDDGDSATAANTSHAYALPGIYDAQLLTTNNCSSDTDTVVVTVDPTLIPSVFASAFPNTVCPGDTVTFNGSGSQLTGYLWNFDDGDISLQEDPMHAFADTGSYNVIFTGTNSCGNSNSDTITVLVDTNAAPVASFWWNPFNVCPNTTVYFTNNSTNSVSSFWDFGDTTTSTVDNPVHAFADTGAYNVQLIATSSCGGQDTATSVVNVVNNAPVWADFCYNGPACFFGTPICLGTPVVFENWSSDTTNSFWDFGDSTTSTDPDPIHIYADTGSYIVVLTVTNECGNSDQRARTIRISNDAAPPGIYIDAFPSSVCPGEDINFAIFILPFFFPIDTADVLWNFGDGDTTRTTNPVHAYDTGGTYTVTLIYYSACGNDTTTRTVTVKSGSAPDFAYTIACPGDTTFFTDASSPLPDTWAWDFGDGDTSTVQNPSNLYAAAGIYNVSLTVVKNGCVSSITKPVPVDNLKIDSTIVTNVSCFGSCNGTATVFPSGGILPYTYLWDDLMAQTTATAAGLCPGTYVITVTDANLCTASDTVLVTEPPLLTVAINDSTNVSCFGLCDGTATATAAGGTPPYIYVWNDPASQTDSTATGLCAGFYAVTVTDANGCTAVDSVTITQPPVLTVSIITTTGVSCFGLCDGDATAAAIGGTPPYAYLWDDPMLQTTATAVGLCAGVYFVIVTDNNGCDTSTIVIITEPPVLTSAITDSTNVSCFGVCDGDATASAGGGTLPYTYLWNDPIAQTTVTADSLCAGTFKVVVTDANGCKDSSSVAITEPPVLTSGISGFNNASCFGVCDGDATATAGGGTPPYTYSWSDPLTQTTVTADSLCAGTFDVVVTDANGCKDTSSVAITEPPVLTSGISGFNNASCFGVCDGDATVTAGGGTPPYTYTWSNGDNVPTADTLCAGIYTVTVTDANGCTATASVTITQPLLLTATITASTNASCNGVCDGTAMVTAGGGTPLYTYLWSNGDNTPTADSLCAGTYTVTVTDANGCDTIASLIITEPPLLTSGISGFNNVSCFGNCDGYATASAGGGTPPYTYLWDDPLAQTTVTADSLCPGTFNFVVTDANGCTDTSSVTITEPPLLTATITASTNASCFGACDGDATVTAGGGTPPYTYLWDYPDAPPLPTVTGLCAGAYMVTVVDANGCTDVSVAIITQPPAITLTLSSIDATCDSADGEASVVTSGGVAPYTYLWDDTLAQTTATATGLYAGAYTVIVTDSTGCTATGAVSVNDSGAATVNISSITDIICNGDSTGAATVTASGGIPPYTYSWSPYGGTDSTATGLSSGTYTVTVNDNNGCIATGIATISEPAALVTTLTGTDVSCAGLCDGSATLTISGGITPYVFSWNTGDTALTITVCAGTYNVMVTDANGCISVDSININEPAVLTSGITSSTNTSCLICDGTTTVTPAGGTAPYIYLWNDPLAQTDSTATGLCAGIYNVAVTDANGCTSTSGDTITGPGGLSSIITSSINVSCNGVCDGGAIVTVTGGVPPYAYLWDDTLAQTTATAGSLCPGTYTATISDSNGCITTSTVVITEPPLLIATITSVTNASCNGVCDGTANATALGGTMPYIYSWSNGDITPVADSLCAGLYTVTITDANGCSVTTSVTITEPALFTLTTAIDNNISCNGGTGGATVSVAGGSAPFDYAWSSGDTTLASASIINSVTGLSAGTYTVLVTDASGCGKMDTVTLGEPSIISAPPLTSTPDTNNTGVGTATVSASGGTPPYNYNWTPSGGTGATAIGLTAGTYTVTVTDTNGCPYEDSVSVGNVTGINNQYSINNNQLKVYPNPNNGIFTIEFNNLTIQQFSNLTIYNILGEVVYTKDSIHKSGDELDIRSLTDGMYLIKLKTESFSVNKRIVIAK